MLGGIFGAASSFCGFYQFFNGIKFSFFLFGSKPNLCKFHVDFDGNVSVIYEYLYFVNFLITNKVVLLCITGSCDGVRLQTAPNPAGK